MNFKTIIYDQGHPVVGELEIALIPGLPQVHILGLPDQYMKESAVRVKTAIRSQGFDWPKMKKLIVNIRPSYRRKTSAGIDFALAAGLLWKTGQCPLPNELDKTIIYGELSLDGKVYIPDDSPQLEPFLHRYKLITGYKSEMEIHFSHHQVQDLRQLKLGCITQPKSVPLPLIERPKFGLHLNYTHDESRLLKILACGEHHWLISGPTGCGKSSLARAVHTFLRPPLILSNMADCLESNWRSLRTPHHTIKSSALVGGGTHPKPGEIYRAHNGILLMDDLLDFDAKLQESLKAPLEFGYINISRVNLQKRFDTDFMFLATSKLCPCGKGTLQIRQKCSCTNLKRRHFLDKLSNSFLERLEGISNLEKRGNPREISGHTLLEEILIIQRFQDSNKEKLVSPITKNSPPNYFHGLSDRRNKSLLRVSRTLADLELSEEIKKYHFEEAYERAVLPFQDLDKLKAEI